MRKNPNELNFADKSVSPKKAYSMPKLVEFGSVSALTGGGGSLPQPDGVSGMGMGPPLPPPG